MPVGSTWSRSRSACCAANAWIAGSTTPTASSVKSPHGRSNETPPALASNGCSQPTRLAPKWAGPILSRPKSHNHCAEVLEAWQTFSDEVPWLNHSHRALVGIASEIRGRLIAGEEVSVNGLNLLRLCWGKWAQRRLTRRKSHCRKIRTT